MKGDCEETRRDVCESDAGSGVARAASFYQTIRHLLEPHERHKHTSMASFKLVGRVDAAVANEAYVRLLCRMVGDNCIRRNAVTPRFAV